MSRATKTPPLTFLKVRAHLPSLLPSQLSPPPPSSLPMSNPYGNYSHYYSKRQVSLINGDPRVALLPPAWVKGKRVLDLGTNSGVVAVEIGAFAVSFLLSILLLNKSDLLWVYLLIIAQRLGPAQVVGIDIDHDLIKKANTHLAFVHSLQQPPPDSTAANPSISEQDTKEPDTECNYFPISLPKTHGFIPLPTPPSSFSSSSSSSPPSTTFPLNLTFHTANFVLATPPSTPESYHLILA